ncbi:HAMP domain-containing sensor histidine kinase [Solwaraspora sp. WMMD406]|uniref:HAMP domain-containing sensor histidine kinase n=1 Tax=Solwaraspora sp. WMMD406 TaxID=3016095 RepID=UPI0024171110|nr:HAMP domain-containing sensor histidine kinase [Solwaraspora sp. WMMD406]MDG4765056.1 HAMP domain-containing sensor histidine kinase [Solwaraspora sp. WMMD406]
MLRRILAVQLALLGAAVLGLGTPLAWSLVTRPGGTPVAWWISLVGLVLLLVIGAVQAARRLSRWLGDPVESLTAEARAWRDGTSQRPVPPAGPIELRRLADAFNDLGARMAALVDRQRAFVSYASHQLRTPLATLRLAVDNLRPPQGDGRDDPQDEYDVLVDEIDRMTRICDSLLAYARAEATAAQATELDLSALVATRVEMWEPAAALAGMQIVRGGADGVVAWVGESAISQCLDALIDNAMKYAGSGAKIVVAAFRLPDGWAQLDVIDNGRGLLAEELSNARQAFWRRAADQNQSGSGLGVTIAETLITASGGTLTLMPARPRGLRAHIRLPADARRR